MNQTTVFGNGIPEEQIDLEVASFQEQFEAREFLDVVVRRGAQQILQQAIEAEVQEFLQQHHERRECRRPSPGGTQWPPGRAQDRDRSRRLGGAAAAGTG